MTAENKVLDPQLNSAIEKLAEEIKSLPALADYNLTIILEENSGFTIASGPESAPSNCPKGTTGILKGNTTICVPN
ncbi:hypothetical protein H6F75_26125 [Nodosilinea sp. FACHB-131]|uniref:hypothetical protein n=1 Tax=Cyanophyceae TaxID=3028117 RepID=UPI001686E62A|nr:hypothetical protein [Nodosilinea sp. FACHB-131]MBD1876966.1 hypothetical protein [Nodosilinea sp. FACHB-131]